MKVIKRATSQIMNMIFFVCALLIAQRTQCQNIKNTESGKNTRSVQVIELRNYLLRPGHRDQFINEFEDKIIDTLNSRGNIVLGQFRVKSAEDNFLWIRGFHNMKARLKALQGFYSSEYWSKHVYIPQAHVLNYTNVHLLKPLDITANNKDTLVNFDGKWFGRKKGIVVIDFLVANERLDQLINFIGTKYDAIIRGAGVKDISYWISELLPNDYPDLPAFQDKNLLVSISFYNDEAEYNAVGKKIQSALNEELKFEMLGIVTTKTTLILYPTEKSFASKAQ